MQVTQHRGRGALRLAGAAALIAACSAPAGAATVFGYTDSVSWHADVNGSTRLNLAFTGGASFMDLDPTLHSMPVQSPISNGKLTAQASSLSCNPHGGNIFSQQCQVYTHFSFMTPIKAFGADWALLSGVLGDGASFLLHFADGSTMAMGEYTHPDGSQGGTTDGFFGWVSDTAVSGFDLFTYYGPEPLSAHQTFSVSNLDLSWVGSSGGGGGGGGGNGTVPEPATLALTLLGLLAAGAKARRPRQPDAAAYAAGHFSAARSPRAALPAPAVAH